MVFLEAKKRLDTKTQDDDFSPVREMTAGALDGYLKVCICVNRSAHLPPIWTKYQDEIFSLIVCLGVLQEKRKAAQIEEAQIDDESRAQISKVGKAVKALVPKIEFDVRDAGRAMADLAHELLNCGLVKATPKTREESPVAPGSLRGIEGINSQAISDARKKTHSVSNLFTRQRTGNGNATGLLTKSESLVSGLIGPFVPSRAQDGFDFRSASSDLSSIKDELYTYALFSEERARLLEIDEAAIEHNVLAVKKGLAYLSEVFGVKGGNSVDAKIRAIATAVTEARPASDKTRSDLQSFFCVLTYLGGTSKILTASVRSFLHDSDSGHNEETLKWFSLNIKAITDLSLEATKLDFMQVSNPSTEMDSSIFQGPIPSGNSFEVSSH